VTPDPDDGAPVDFVLLNTTHAYYRYIGATVVAMLARVCPDDLNLCMGTCPLDDPGSRALCLETCVVMCGSELADASGDSTEDNIALGLAAIGVLFVAGTVFVAALVRRARQSRYISGEQLLNPHEEDGDGTRSVQSILSVEMAQSCPNISGSSGTFNGIASA
jgi:hypothetical protein